MTEVLECLLVIMMAVLGSGKLDFDYRDGNLSTWFTAPFNKTRIGHIEPDLSIKGNLMYLVLSGQSPGELRSTGGGKTNPTTVLTPSSVYNMTERFNSTLFPSPLVLDFRQVSANALILQLYDMFTVGQKGHLAYVSRENNEMLILGVSQLGPVPMGGLLVDSSNRHHLYLIHNGALLFVDLYNSPESFLRLHKFSEKTSTYFDHLPPILSQHGEYVYACVLGELTQKYELYRISKFTDDRIPSDGVEVTRLDIEIPHLRTGLSSFVMLDESSFLVGSIYQLLLQQGETFKGVCKTGIPFSEGTLDTCSLRQYAALAIYNDNVYIATEHRIARLVWINNDGTPSVNGSDNPRIAEVVTEYISTVQWLLPLGLSVAGVLVASILIFTAMKIRKKRITRQTQSTARELPGVPQSSNGGGIEDENYSQITAAELSPEEEIYNIIGDDYYELNVDNVEEYADINIIQPHTTETPSSGVQPSPEDYLNPVSRIDLETETSDPV